MATWLVPPDTNADKCQVENWKRSLEFWIRILHSLSCRCDWLDAETRDLDNPPRPEFPTIEELRDILDKLIDKKVSEAKNDNWTLVNQQREIVLNACRALAEEPSGFFSLTVPTGGGKTLSAMSFALNHALENELQRVIVVIPYTSIIKQNANVYAEVFGQENVIELQAWPEKDMKGIGWHLKIGSRIVVTTNVQFFESLYTSKFKLET